MTTAVVFPGMGPVRFADVANFVTTNPHAVRMLADASAVLGYSVIDAVRADDDPYSEAAQVAFAVNCLALAAWAGQELDMQPHVVAGPSFGAKAAMAYTGALSFADTIRMTAELARCTKEYFACEHTDVVTYSFARTPQEKLRQILTEVDDWHEVSCHVDHDFHMVTLREARLDWFQLRIRAAGGLPLFTMRPPMHSSAFTPLREQAHELLTSYRFGNPALPVVSDHDGSVVSTAAGMRELLLDGFVRPMRWPSVVTTLREMGVRTVCVAGSDSLFGRVKCTTANFEVKAINPRLAML